jgi:hypothetical protein
MDMTHLIPAAAAVVTMIAAILVAANISPRLMVIGFTLFVVASGLWLIDGYMTNKMSLVVQNAVLAGINVVGLYRWLPKV